MLASRGRRNITVLDNSDYLRTSAETNSPSTFSRGRVATSRFNANGVQFYAFAAGFIRDSFLRHIRCNACFSFAH
jgi:hypothetical protein